MTTAAGAFEAWLAGRTVRRHGMDCIRRENIAEHTWGMLMLLLKYLPEARKEVQNYIILHDAGERKVGDIPAHVGWEFPEIQKGLRQWEKEYVLGVLTGPHTPADHFELLTPQELLWVEVLDRAEFFLGCVYEHRLGNTMQDVPRDNSFRKILKTMELVEAGPAREALFCLVRDLQKALQP